MSKPISTAQGVSHPGANSPSLGVSHQPSTKRSINLRMDATEAAIIEQAAKKSGRSLAGFIRYAALQMLNSQQSEN